MAEIKDKDISELRKKIDVIDHDLLRLLEKRFDIVWEISKLKKKKGLPARDVEREIEIIRHKCKLTHLTPHIVGKIYSAIIESSLEFQGGKNDNTR
jgi:chorismate mutase